MTTNPQLVKETELINRIFTSYSTTKDLDLIPDDRLRLAIGIDQTLLMASITRSLIDLCRKLDTTNDLLGSMPSAGDLTRISQRLGKP